MRNQLRSDIYWNWTLAYVRVPAYRLQSMDMETIKSNRRDRSTAGESYPCEIFSLFILRNSIMVLGGNRWCQQRRYHADENNVSIAIWLHGKHLYQFRADFVCRRLPRIVRWLSIVLMPHLVIDVASSQMHILFHAIKAPIWCHRRVPGIRRISTHQLATSNGNIRNYAVYCHCPLAFNTITSKFVSW